MIHCRHDPKKAPAQHSLPRARHQEMRLMQNTGYSDSKYIDMSLEDFSGEDLVSGAAWPEDIYEEYAELAESHEISLTEMVELHRECIVWDAQVAAWVLTHEQRDRVIDVLTEDVPVGDIDTAAGYALSDGDISYEEIERRLELGLWEHEIEERDERVRLAISPDHNGELPRDVESVYRRIMDTPDALDSVLYLIANDEYTQMERLGLTYDDDICPVATFAEPLGELVAGDANHIIVYVSGCEAADRSSEPRLELHTTAEWIAGEDK